MRHVARRTPILCGRDEAADYFIFDKRGDPVMLACYEQLYTLKDTKFSELHPDTQRVYQSVTSQGGNVGYAEALSHLTQEEVRQVILEIAYDRDIPVYKRPMK